MHIVRLNLYQWRPCCGIFANMEEKLQIAFAKGQDDIAAETLSALWNAGYPAEIASNPIDPARIVILILYKGSSLDGLFANNPWLKEQFEYCSYPYLRLLPFVPYHSKSEDFDALWEENIEDVYENLISGEFKPYGWDLDDPNSKAEFARILEEYEE